MIDDWSNSILIFDIKLFCVFKFLSSGENVWEDIHPDSQEFIKEYLAQYPEVSEFFSRYLLIKK